MSNSWKDLLLKSGIPLENDVKKYFDSKGCISDFEYSYLKLDENNIEKEFSYDIDASLIESYHFVNFMIECKYRHEGTKWFFIPQIYGGYNEIFPNSFMHPSDYFVPLKFKYSDYFPRRLAPLCGKGIEISDNSINEKSITQAIYQLSYAFAPQIASAIEHQIYKLLAGDVIFYHVPVIITTAKLYRLNENVNISTIKESKNIEDISKEYQCLVMEYTAGELLEKYNLQIFTQLRNRIGDDILLEKNKSFTDDLNHLFSVISKHYCPQAIVIIHYSQDLHGMDEFINYIKNLINPPEDLLKEIKKDRLERKKRLKKFKEKYGTLFKRNV